MAFVVCDQYSTPGSPNVRPIIHFISMIVVYGNDFCALFVSSSYSFKGGKWKLSQKLDSIDRCRSEGTEFRTQMRSKLQKLRSSIPGSPWSYSDSSETTSSEFRVVASKLLRSRTPERRLKPPHQAPSPPPCHFPIRKTLPLICSITGCPKVLAQLSDI